MKRKRVSLFCLFRHEKHRSLKIFLSWLKFLPQDRIVHLWLPTAIRSRPGGFLAVVSSPVGDYLQGGCRRQMHTECFHFSFAPESEPLPICSAWTNTCVLCMVSPTRVGMFSSEPSFLWSQRLLSSSKEHNNMRREKVAWSWWPEAWRLGVAWHRQRPTWEAHQKLCLATNSAPLLIARLQSFPTCAVVKPAGEEVKMQHRRQTRIKHRETRGDKLI